MAMRGFTWAHYPPTLCADPAKVITFGQQSKMHEACSKCHTALPISRRVSSCCWPRPSPVVLFGTKGFPVPVFHFCPLYADQYSKLRMFITDYHYKIDMVAMSLGYLQVLS